MKGRVRVYKERPVRIYGLRNRRKICQEGTATRLGADETKKERILVQPQGESVFEPESVLARADVMGPCEEGKQAALKFGWNRVVDITRVVTQCSR